jgi:transposase-like protein
LWSEWINVYISQFHHVVNRNEQCNIFGNEEPLLNAVLNDLTTFFDYPVEIRKIIYTTNLIENLNSRIRKYTKAKLSFLNDDAYKKLGYCFESVYHYF